MASYSIESIKGVGPSVAAKFRVLGIKSISDLINYYPRRYEDFSKVSTISAIKPGSAVTIKGSVKQVNGRYVRRGMHITEAVISDSTGSMKLVWFNQPYRAAAIKPNAVYYVSGSFELSRGRLSIMNPAMELESAFQVNTARIIPIYRETKGLKSSAIRKAVAAVKADIENLPETLPEAVVKTSGLLSRSDALRFIHFPDSTSDIEKAKDRLGFEELFSITLASLLNKQQFLHESGVEIPFDEKTARRFTQHLPYDLTDAQRKVVWQIYKDMQARSPMNRLVEGDVGSGKTVVAAMAALMAMQAGYQVAFMAPTELLAAQHYETFKKLLAWSAFAGRIGLLTGGMKSLQKKEAHEKLTSGDLAFVVGTHALITEAVDIKNLGLVIIDEQHRFGVEQRKKLQSKAGLMPHILSMTATPIPRTLALTIYGELDVSVIDELPPGRSPTLTRVVSPNSRRDMYVQVEQQLQAGRQVFVVCPLIEESEAIQVFSAEKVYEELSKKVFRQHNVGLLHGKMKTADKEKIMRQFIEKKLDILVSTTVVEVGVDVPNASVMMVEGVERFGLAQLHQLRGRVGRGGHPGFCYLIMSDSSPPPRRLRALESTSDGFKLAELDLEIRGPGAIYGTIQSGQLDLRVANLADTKLVARARQAAAGFLESGEKLTAYPLLEKRVQKYRSVTNLN